MLALFFIFGIILGGQSASASNLRASNKDIVDYTATMNSITPAYLPSGSSATAMVELTIVPSDRAKYAPKSITLLAETNTTIFELPIDVNSFTGPGTYTLNLIEGKHLPVSAQYEVSVVVDSFTSNALPVAVWHVDHLTAATDPSNTNRQTIGVGEQVSLTIQPQLDSSADVQWTAPSNVGATLSTVLGQSTLFTASETPGASTPFVSVGPYGVGIPFSVIAPNSISVSVNSNPGYGSSAVSKSSATHLGAYTLFNVVLGPPTVNFYNAIFRENVPASFSSLTWPSGVVTTVNNSNSTPSRVGSLSGTNTVPDQFKSGFVPTSYIAGGDFHPAVVSWFEQYQDGSGQFNNFGTQVSWKLDVSSATLQAQMTHTGVPGSSQGPWGDQCINCP